MVRRELKLDFAGGTYAHVFYVADVNATGADTNDLLMNLDHEGFGLMMPVRSTGMYRLAGLVPDDLVARTDLKFADSTGGHGAGAMQMGFAVTDKKLLDGVKKGDTVEFEMHGLPNKEGVFVLERLQPALKPKGAR